LREGRVDLVQAAEEWAKAVESYIEQLEWRRAGEGTISEGLKTYLAAISDTIGSRQQPRLSREQALFIAGCNASHRDVSLNF
jgi:hypothetical protein